jgi:hypothetical protein
MRPKLKQEEEAGLLFGHWVICITLKITRLSPSPLETVSQYEKTHSWEKGRGGRVEKI